MTDLDLLTMLKVDLGISSDAYDERLEQYLEAAKSRLTRLGITLADTIDDNTLVIQYAAWTWRNRDTNTGLPRWMTYAINNRVFAEHMRDSEDDADG